ncbi:MAG: family 43 glycosylhydrolase [Clostridiaceae bacterium]|nr:family 43 glycosylhydrolase [Clostridiaceae bacterium]
MMFTNKEKNNFAKDPAVVRFKDQYYMYYTILYKEHNSIGVGIAKSSDMESWDLCGEIPITEEYEKNGIGAPGAIVLHDQVHLFYQTYGNGKQDAICHAVSTNAIDFEKDRTNPVYRPTNDWCCGRAIDADLCVFNNKLYMYVATRDHAMEIQKIGGAYADINSDFSKNTWTQIANQAILHPELEWEGKCIEAPAVIVNNGKIFMFYGGSYNCTPQQIGCAASCDGAYFTRVFNEPFIPCGQEGQWNSSESGHPFVFRNNDGRIYLFYQGSCDMGKTWYITKTEIMFDDYNIPKLLG